MPSTPPNHSILISRTFNAPRALVWAAWTNPKHLAQWWGPRGFNAEVKKFDLRPGGQFLLHLQGPDGNTYPCQGTFNDVSQPERLSFIGQAEDCHPCGAGLPPRSLVTVTFVEQNNKTELTIHTIFDTAATLEAAAKNGYNQGWTQSLERIEELLTKLS